ncbi:hypothetical protein [uncultured Megasphaera sp.]|nr:hypothetical protein [uncultured Megasphaera sp.]
MIPRTVQIDLCHDMERIAKSQLNKLGFDSTEVENLKNPLLRLLEYNIKRIPLIKREIAISAEFKCPSAYQRAFGEFIQKVKNGEDINPFLSNKRDSVAEPDLLLYDWGVHHFHLTRRYNKKGKPTRSDYLIFAVCTDERMYFIQIYSHKKVAVFAQQEILEIIYKNWPYLLKSFELSGISIDDMSDQERMNIRNKHGLSLTGIFGKPYFSPGGGYMSDGSAFIAVHQSDFVWNQLKSLEEWIINNLSLIKSLYHRSAGQNMKRDLFFF